MPLPLLMQKGLTALLKLVKFTDPTSINQAVTTLEQHFTLSAYEIAQAYQNSYESTLNAIIIGLGESSLLSAKVKDEFAQIVAETLPAFAAKSDLQNQALSLFCTETIVKCKALIPYQTQLFQADKTTLTDNELVALLTDEGPLSLTEFVIAEWQPLKETRPYLDDRTIAFLRYNDLLGKGLLFFLEEELRQNERFRATVQALQNQGLWQDLREIKGLLQKSVPSRDLSAPFQPQDELTHHTSDSLRLIREAVARLKTLPTNHPHYSQLMIKGATVLSSTGAGALEEAEQFLLQAQQMAQNDADKALIAFNLFQIRLRRGEFEPALANLQTAIQLDAHRYALHDVDKYPNERPKSARQLVEALESLRADLVPKTSESETESTNTDDYQIWFDKAYELAESGRYQEAIDSYDKALQFKPDKDAAWYNRGNALSELGRYQEAIDSYDKALQFKPDDDEAWLNRGSALDDLGRYQEAIDSYDKALQFKPDKDAAWYNRGIALGKLERYEQAIDSYDKALQIKPDKDEAWNNRGIALRKLERYEEAIDSYDKALQIKPDKDEAWYNRGIALRKLERYEEAIDSYDKALQIKPDKDEAWYNRGLALSDLGRYQEAIDSYDKALQIKPDDNWAWYNRGNALYNLKRYQEAIDSYDNALQIKPDKDEAWYNRGNALDDLGRYQEAIDSYDKALQINPDLDVAWNNRGLALRKLERYEEAIDSYDKALQINPDLDMAWYGRGFTLYHLKHYEEAIENYDKALQIKPDEQLYLNNRKRALKKLKSQ